MVGEVVMFSASRVPVIVIIVSLRDLVKNIPMYMFGQFFERSKIVSFIHFFIVCAFSVALEYEYS